MNLFKHGLRRRPTFEETVNLIRKDIPIKVGANNAKLARESLQLTQFDTSLLTDGLLEQQKKVMHQQLQENLINQRASSSGLSHHEVRTDSDEMHSIMSSIPASVPVFQMDTEAEQQPIFFPSAVAAEPHPAELEGEELDAHVNRETIKQMTKEAKEKSLAQKAIKKTGTRLDARIAKAKAKAKAKSADVEMEEVMHEINRGIENRGATVQEMAKQIESGSPSKRLGDVSSDDNTRAKAKAKSANSNPAIAGRSSSSTDPHWLTTVTPESLAPTTKRRGKGRPRKAIAMKSTPVVEETDSEPEPEVIPEKKKQVKKTKFESKHDPNKRFEHGVKLDDDKNAIYWGKRNKTYLIEQLELRKEYFSPTYKARTKKEVFLNKLLDKLGIKH